LKRLLACALPRAARASVRELTRPLMLALMIGLVGLSGGLAGCDRSSSKASFSSTDVTGADYGKSLSLTDQSGQVRTLADFKGKVVVLFFGFTQCPDVCPTTLSAMAEVMKALGPEAARVQVIFVTLDPERDSAALLGAYVTAFNPTFIALRGDAEATTRAAREFKVFFQKVPGKTPGAYSLDHTAASYALDDQGRLRLYIRSAQTVPEITADLRLLLAGR
jgi:protein SCO1/2